jgi:hypothetical protein
MTTRPRLHIHCLPSVGSVYPLHWLACRLVMSTFLQLSSLTHLSISWTESYDDLNWSDRLPHLKTLSLSGKFFGTLDPSHLPRSLTELSGSFLDVRTDIDSDSWSIGLTSLELMLENECFGAFTFLLGQFSTSLGSSSGIGMVRPLPKRLIGIHSIILAWSDSPS